MEFLSTVANQLFLIKMKNLLSQFIKTREQKNKLDLISELLISGTVEENISLFKKAEARFHYEMDLERNKKQVEINLINRIKPIKEINPDFEKKISEIETNFEIISNEK